MPDYRALAQALDPYAMDTGGITPDTIKALKTVNKSPNLLGMIADIGRGGLSNLESLIRGGVAQFGGTPVDTLNTIRTPYPMEVMGDVNYAPDKQVYGGTKDILGMMPKRVTQARPETAGMEELGTVMGPGLAKGVAPAVKGYASLLGNEVNAGMTGQPTRSIIGQITPKPLQLDVYHGTPHSFERFDASKIGTGEGAQAYGHGIYVAESPEVARGYANRLGANLIMVDGKPMDFNDPVHIAASIISDPNNAGLPGERLASAIRYDPRGIVPFGAESKVEEIAKALESGNLPKFTNQKGNFYKADLPDEMIPKMLNWDKPLSEQTPEVQKILYPYQKEIGSSFGTGEQTLRQIAFERRMKGLDDSPSAVAQQLKDMGITGVRYLDEASRGTNYRGDSAFFHAATDFKVNDYSFDDALDGMKKAYKNATEQELRDALDAVYTPKTSNFVVFPGQEQNLTILERNSEKITK
jgi:hypothetical protein